MFVCSECGKEFVTNGPTPDHSYGFKSGKPFIVVLCDNCKNKLTNVEKEDLEFKDADKEF